MLQTNSLPSKIRVSIGTAITLGLTQGKIDVAPTTAYLMTYREGKCTSKCDFCPQANTSKSSSQLLSRVTWPTYPMIDVLSALPVAVKQQKIHRVCIQALNYPQVFNNLNAMVRKIKASTTVAVSVSCQSRNRIEIEQLKDAGVNRVGIALDGATEEIFERVKGSCNNWNMVFGMLREALTILGKGNVSTHLIIGLGESEWEAIETIQKCADLGVLPALFAFTPIRGTVLEKNAPPKLESYRRLQLARFLIVTGKTKAQNMSFSADGKIICFGLSNEALERIIFSGEPFRTSGCPECNRPFYNEKPSGPIYNFPVKPTTEEIMKIKKELSN